METLQLEEEEEKKKEPCPAAGVSCSPGRRRNLLPRWVFDAALVFAPDLGQDSVPRCPQQRGHLTRWRCQTRNAELFPAAAAGLCTSDRAREYRDSSELIVGLVTVPKPTLMWGRGSCEPQNTCSSQWCQAELWEGVTGRSSSSHHGSVKISATEPKG